VFVTLSSPIKTVKLLSRNHHRGLNNGV